MPARIPHLTTTLSMRLTAEERRMIEERARDENRTTSNYIRKCLREHLLLHARPAAT